jgi:hypothetical protein
MWFYVDGIDSSSPGPFYKYAPTDSAPVAVGQLGTGISVNIPDTTVRMAAGKGKLYLQHNDAETTGYRFYYKASNTTANFAWSYKTGDFIIVNEGVSGSGGPTTTTPGQFQYPVANGMWYLRNYTASTPDQIQINYFDNTDGTITSYLTGIEWAASGQILVPIGYAVTDTGLHVIPTVRYDGPDERVTLATFNLSTTSYVYTDFSRSPNLYDGQSSNVWRVADNVYEWGYGEIPGGLGTYNGLYRYRVTLT